jgi:phage tail protein X
VLAIPEMGRLGLGRFDPRQGGRGRFVLRAVTAINPLTGATQPLLASGTQVQMPAIPVEPAQVAAKAGELAERARADGDLLRLRFLTPTRIVAGSRLVHRPAFGPLFQRLVERVTGLARHYGGAGKGGEFGVSTDLLALADRVELVEDGTRWVDLLSSSRRLGRSTPVGGYVGEAAYRADDWGPLLTWLLWGQSLHVGKSAVKGDGWFTVGGCPGWPGAAPITGWSSTPGERTIYRNQGGRG